MNTAKSIHTFPSPWSFFKDLISSSSSTTITATASFLQSITAISTHLATNRLLPEISQLHHHILNLTPSSISQSSLIILIRTTAKFDLLDSALSQFRSLRSQFQSNPPKVQLYNNLIEAALRSDQPEAVEFLYEDMIVSGVTPDTYTFNLMIGSLCESGQLEDARKMFDGMTMKSVMPNKFSFGILVRGYCRAGMCLEGLEVLNRMKTVYGCKPNRVVYNTLVSEFCRQGKFEEAEKLVDRMREDGLSPNVVTFNSRISVLCKAGNVSEAFKIFMDMKGKSSEGLPRPNGITYDVMLDGFCMGGMPVEADNLVGFMKKTGNFTKLQSHNIWLSGMVRCGKMFEAQVLLNEMVRSGLKPSIYSYNILIDGLCKESMLSDARSMVNLMTSGGIVPDTVTYSTLIHGYCSKGKVIEANHILHEMVSYDCVPNIFTCNILLQSLWKEGRSFEAERLLQKMNEKGYGFDMVTCNTVIHGLCRNGELDKAIEIIKEMWILGSKALGLVDNSIGAYNSKRCVPDLITYSILIDALCKAGRFDEAKQKFLEMMSKNIHPDLVIYDTFISGFVKHGKLASAFKVHRDMADKGCSSSTRTYNVLIRGLGKRGKINEIHDLMTEMRENKVYPDALSHSILVESLCETGKFSEAASIVEKMIQDGKRPSLSAFQSLIKALCKVSDLKAAYEIFEISLTCYGHKEILYSLIFNEMCSCGKTREAKSLLMIALERKITIQRFNYKKLIKDICKEEENVLEADKLINTMMNKGYVFDPAVFIPVIDNLKQKGYTQEAHKLTDNMIQMGSTYKEVNIEGANEMAAKLSFLNRKVAVRSHSTENASPPSDWSSILQRDDGSGIAMRLLKKVKKGWGQGSTPRFKTEINDFNDF
ncbi:putative Pentatricopeptide repeat-containing protein [Zostera marina]|uniref:Putative Pentatricopeptide repeat-containing protein n=1 Tax=Zostera marina TaxID=29655 RepID=A0A0K9Q4X9_ZOSMR|nr:putative Pentatricopeptide repeat-containing protein [Zostera marina]